MDKRKILQPLLAVLVLGAGVGTLVTLKNTKPEAQREEKRSEGVLVEVERFQARRHEVVIRAQGTVIPAERVVVVPEINGRIVWQHKELVPGGRVRKGENLVRIDPRDYELQLEARRADVSRAELELRLEKSQQEVARREWDKFGPETTTTSADGGSLALREPQVQTARVAVQSSKSALDQARLSLGKTSIQAPFNALVVSEDVDKGQLVGPQSQMATLVGTDEFWVRVSVPIEALTNIRIPGRGGAKKGSEALVWQRVGGERVERTGEVRRILPDLDPGGTMARILVSVEDPLGLDGSEGEQTQKLPLLLNSYVNVEIAAPPIDDAIEVPRIALRDGDKVYVMDAQDRLRFRDVRVVWRRPDSVLVSDGLESSERVVTSRVPAATEGMHLRLERGAKPPSAANDAQPMPPEAKARASTEELNSPPKPSKAAASPEHKL